MKYIFHTLLLIICIGIGWFGNNYYLKKSLPEPEIIVKTDTLYQTITNAIIDTIKIKQAIYIPKKIIKEITVYDTIYLEQEKITSLYKYNPDPFSIEALCYAECVVDSIHFSYYPNKQYFEDFGMRFYRDGYLYGQFNYPGWKKLAYFSAGVIGTYALLRTANELMK